MPDVINTITVNLTENQEELGLTLSDTAALDVELMTGQGSGSQILVDTTAHWNAQPQLIAKKDLVYVYSDFLEIDGEPVAGIKIGDGSSFLIDMAFTAGNTAQLNEHIQDAVRHITAQERTFWNNKVTCFISQADPDTLIFTKLAEE